MRLFRRAATRRFLPVIHIEGHIDDFMVKRVRACLSRIKKSNIQALSIVLDTNGGSPVQADIMAHDLKTFCEDRDIQLFSFIEEKATAGAVIPLSISDRVFALNSSVIGRFGPEASQLRFGTDLNLKAWTTESQQQLIGKHFKLIPDEKESELQFERLMGALLESDKKKQMEAFKEKHQSRVGPETMQDLLDGVTFDGNEGVKMKFVDGIGTYNIVLKKLFPGADVVRITPKDWYRTQVRHWMWNIDKEYLIFIYLIIAYKVGSYIFKLVAAKYFGTKNEKGETITEA